jgi:hypothetical protein
MIRSIFENINNNNYYLYHILGGEETEVIKKYGILSPYELLNKEPKLFHKTTYQNYKDRTKIFLNKNSVTDEDVINYLDNSPRRMKFTSKAIFLSFISNDNMPYVTRTFSEFKINLNNFKTKKFVIVSPSNGVYDINLKDLKKNFNLFKEDALKGAKIKHSGTQFKNITHLAAIEGMIPYKYLERV